MLNPLISKGQKSVAPYSAVCNSCHGGRVHCLRIWVFLQQRIPHPVKIRLQRFNVVLCKLLRNLIFPEKAAVRIAQSCQNPGIVRLRLHLLHQAAIKSRFPQNKRSEVFVPGERGQIGP